MQIELPPDLAEKVNKLIAEGRASSPDELLTRALDCWMLSELSDRHDDLDWAKPMVDEALASRGRGESRPLSELVDHLRDRRRKRAASE